jgi:hypothetical protein
MGGHDQNQAVTANSRRHGEGDTGIAAGGFDQRIPRLDLTPSLRLCDGRSFTDPAGLLPSSLARMVLLVRPGMRCRRTSGVLPMQASIVG